LIFEEIPEHRVIQELLIDNKRPMSIKEIKKDAPTEIPLARLLKRPLFL